jgi:hypothetical protein
MTRGKRGPEPPLLDRKDEAILDEIWRREAEREKKKTAPRDRAKKDPPLTPRGAGG